MSLSMFGWLKKQAPAGVGLFGKIPDEGDFVSHNATDPAVPALDQWLQNAIDKARHAGSEELPAGTIRFVFRSTDAKTALIGVMRPSQDAVGRVFPLCVFISVSAPKLAARFSSLPLLFHDFFESAAELLDSAGERSLEELCEELEAIEPPNLDLEEAEESLRPILSASRGADSWERLFGTDNLTSRFYALQTFGAACRAVQREDLSKSGATIDCPVANPDDVVFWLHLAQTLLGWKKAPPSFFWIDGESPRLVLSLGPATPVVLLSLLQPNLDSPKLWSLKTQDTAAREAAKGSFQPNQQELIGQDGVTNDALIASLARA
jgi:type VI secretion system protein ImpM